MCGIFPPSPTYFVITSGATEPHLRAIVNEITDRLREDYGLSPRAVDGDGQCAVAGDGFL